MKKTKHRKKLRSRQTRARLFNARATPVILPPGPTVDAYRIAGYVDGLIGATPESDLLKPHFDSGLTWTDGNNPQPGDWLWGAGVRGGLPWDGTFYRDLTRYAASGALFWSAYLKPGSGPGIQNGFWFNFGSGWSHLANDDFSQLLTGASQRLFWDAGVVAPVPGASGPAGAAGTAAATPGHWKLVIEATMFVTNAVVNVWTGAKPFSPDPTGQYTRMTGCDPTTTLTVEVHS
ncbi:MAG: hypothetical protein PCFJNLEI_03991 [Verrucomicrobiae bacterium]|nr:hypothetical protein [Verrucomicrobiae bacterium]